MAVCIYCGKEISDKETKCPHCGRDLTTYRTVLGNADRFYNDGLEKAKVRDLSGAILSLREALRCDKYQTDARNLLGLCLFERGDRVEAMSEWVISKNLQKEKNRADYYLKEIQKPGELDRINAEIRKYNQALKYCADGSFDLAKLELRRIIHDKGTMVEACQLLALLSIHDKEYAAADKILRKAASIDVRNTVTLRYQDELRRILEDPELQKKKKRKKANVISFQDGNEMVTVPSHPLRNLIDGSWYTLVNIAIGFGLGLLVCFFLIVPTIRQNAKNATTNSLADANAKVTNSSANISNLQAQVKSLQEELDKYTGKSDVVTSYEQVIQANNAVQANDLDTASTLLQSVNRDLLSDQGKAVYDSVNAAVNAKTLTDSYNAGVKSYNSGDYAAAITSLTQVTGLDESYENGQALYRLGEAYEKSGDTANALNSYNRLQELFPDTSVANRAKSRADKLNADQAADAGAEADATQGADAAAAQ